MTLKSGVLWNALVAGSLLSVATATTASAQETCTPRHEGMQTIEKGYLTPAVTILTPVSFIDENGKLAGVDGDILTEIAKMECLEIKNLTVDPAAAVQSVVSKRADTTVGGWYRTAERGKVVSLSAPIWLSQMGVWSKDGIDSIDGLAGKNVGAVQGDLWIADVKAVFGEKLSLYPNSVAMQQDLMAGRLDAALQGVIIGVAAKAAGTLEGIEVKAVKPDPRVRASEFPGQINFPVSKDNPSLLAAFDDDINELHKNGKITEILLKYGMEASAGDTGEPRVLE